MKNKVIIIGGDHSNALGVIRAFGENGVNIENMGNGSKGDYAYTIVDTADTVTAAVTDKFNAIDGVIKVRVI